MKPIRARLAATDSFGRWSRPLEHWLRARTAVGPEVVLGQKRIYIMPTRYGVFFAITLLVMLIGSINYNNSMGYALTFLLGSLGLLSILYTYRNLVRIQLSAGKAQTAFAGSEARFALRVHNPSAVARYALAFKLEKRRDPVLVDVPAEGEAEAVLSLPAKRRGYLPSGTVTVFTSFPLGLFRAWSYADVHLTCLVYPKPSAPFKTPLARHYDGRAQGRSSQDDGSDDFLGFRNYHPGDSLHHVHWKAVARGLPLLTKQFSAYEAPEWWLSWEAFPGVETEKRLSRLCRLVLDAHTSGVPFGLKLPGKVIALNQGAAHERQCLEALALFQAGPRS